MSLHDIILIAVMVLVSALVQRWTAAPKIASPDEARLARLERKVDMLLAQLRTSGAGEGAALPSGVPMDEVRALVRQGNTIGAIKLYREMTGEGLQECKDAVEALAITERMR